MALPLVALVVPAAWIYGLPAFLSAPSHHGGGGPRAYYCGDSDAPRPPDLVVEFRERGRLAVVRRPIEARLRFVGEDWMTETYQGEGYTLKLDPEAMLSGPNLRLARCN